MGVRISRILGSVFGSQGVQSKTGDTERDAQQRPHYEQSGNSEQEKRFQEDAQDPKKIEKAISELKASKEFLGTGIQVEKIQTKFGYQVRLIQADGTHLRTMSALEFLRLKDSSSDDKTTRGKLVDQKF